MIVDSLRDAGDFDIHAIGQTTGLGRRIKALNPDVVLIDIADPSRDMLEELALASGPLDRPRRRPFLWRNDKAPGANRGPRRAVNAMGCGGRI